MNLTENEKCTFCQEHPEEIKHIFLECEYVRYFWDSFMMLLYDSCELNNIVFDAESSPNSVVQILIIY